MQPMNMYKWHPINQLTGDQSGHVVHFQIIKLFMNLHKIPTEIKFLSQNFKEKLQNIIQVW